MQINVSHVEYVKTGAESVQLKVNRMIVHVRNEDVYLKDNSSIDDWMNEYGLINKEVALIQVNDREINRNDYKKYILQNGDRIQVLYFLGDS